MTGSLKTDNGRDLVKVRLPWPEPHVPGWEAAGHKWTVDGETVWATWRDDLRQPMEPFQVEINNTPCHKGYKLGQIIKVEHVTESDGMPAHFEHHPGRPFLFIPTKDEMEAAEKRGDEHLAAVRTRFREKLIAVWEEFKNEPLDLDDELESYLKAVRAALDPTVFRIRKPAEITEPAA